MSEIFYSHPSLDCSHSTPLAGLLDTWLCLWDAAASSCANCSIRAVNCIFASRPSFFLFVRHHSLLPKHSWDLNRASLFLPVTSSARSCVESGISSIPIPLPLPLVPIRPFLCHCCCLEFLAPLPPWQHHLCRDHQLDLSQLSCGSFVLCPNSPSIHSCELDIAIVSAAVVGGTWFFGTRHVSAIL